MPDASSFLYAGALVTTILVHSAPLKTLRRLGAGLWGGPQAGAARGMEVRTLPLFGASVICLASCNTFHSCCIASAHMFISRLTWPFPAVQLHHKLRRDPNWHPSACNICGQVREHCPANAGICRICLSGGTCLAHNCSRMHHDTTAEAPSLAELCALPAANSWGTRR